jgi:hypothetical protein
VNVFAPSAIAFAAVGLAVLAQYFLKLRRPRKTLPSTYLWARAVVDTRANTPWQRLRAEPLLLLQLLAVVVIVFALMRPYVLRAGTIGSNVVLVLDASLTTQTVEKGHSRFDLEVAKAHAIVDGMPPDKSVSVIRLDGRPRVLLAGSTDKGDVDATLAGQKPGFEQPDTPAALNLALALASQGGAAKALVILLRSAATPVPPHNTSVPIQDIVFGSPASPNLGIDSLVAQSQPNGAINALYRVINNGSVKLDSDVELRADGKLEAVDHIAVPAGSYVLHSTTFLAKGASVIEARLSGADSLTADNTTWSVVNQQSHSKILVVTAGNVFLSSVLSALSDFDVATVDPQHYSPALASGSDLVIFDQVVPRILPPADLLLIDPPGDVLGIHTGGDRTADALELGDDPNGLLRFVTLADIHVFMARVASVPDWAHVALRDRTGPLLLEGTTSNGATGLRCAVILFDLRQSDLPLARDFPILISNLLSWLAPDSSIDQATVHPGDFVHITLPADTSVATVRAPDGTQLTLVSAASDQQGGQVTFTNTDTPGVYTVTVVAGAVRRQELFVVTPQIAPGSLSASASAIQSGGSAIVAKTGQVPVELTGGIAMAALLVLAAEWFVAMRLR